MKDWEKEVYEEESDSWGYDSKEEAWEKTKHHRSKGISFTEEQWSKFKSIDGEGLWLSAYSESDEDHTGPIKMTINSNDTFFYACSMGTDVPPDKVDEVLELCEKESWNELTALAADIEGLPPLNEYIEDMEKEGRVPKEKIAFYKQQHIDRGTENDRW